MGVNLSGTGFVGRGKVECVSISKLGIWRHFCNRIVSYIY